MCETPFWTCVARPCARGRQRRMFLLGPLSTVALLMKSASRSWPGFFTLALETALSMTLRSTGAPAFGVNSRSWSASVASLPRTRFAIIRALRGEMRACIALALAIIGETFGGKEPRAVARAGSWGEGVGLLLSVVRPLPLTACGPPETAALARALEAGWRREGRPPLRSAVSRTGVRKGTAL